MVVAELPYQVGFASLERKLEVFGEPAADGRRGPWPLWFELPGFVSLVGVPLCRSRGRLGRFCAAQQALHTDSGWALVVGVSLALMGRWWCSRRLWLAAACAA